MEWRKHDLSRANCSLWSKLPAIVTVVLTLLIDLERRSKVVVSWDIGWVYSGALSVT